MTNVWMNAKYNLDILKLHYTNITIKNKNENYKNFKKCQHFNILILDNNKKNTYSKAYLGSQTKPTFIDCHQNQYYGSQKYDNSINIYMII